MNTFRLVKVYNYEDDLNIYPLSTVIVNCTKITDLFCVKKNRFYTNLCHAV